LKTYFFELCYP